jgi:hypothetical protein
MLLLFSDPMVACRTESPYEPFLDDDVNWRADSLHGSATRFCFQYVKFSSPALLIYRVDCSDSYDELLMDDPMVHW